MAADKDKSQNPFDILNHLGDLADIKKILGPDFFKNLPLPQMRGPWFADTAGDAEDRFPRVDLYGRGSHEMVAVFELPGLTSSADVQLSVRPHALRVRGQVTARFQLKGDTVWMAECHHGAFDREIELPERVVVDDVRAVYRSGLLVVYLTKDKAHADAGSAVPVDFGTD
ncbi:hypothetical protein GCM10010885_19810 [Alicyclobacillus cellulosilyticus]|uniref:SHSP domain-containing protein n=1 Tax=Alicyclobacillus cellulosilyticus TaxID=1003997 RepID=A0A917KDX8_9BACL|nr:Hsp20 family protein [Alicyclobacillus cellulosilyticus]GGJ10641.1 hypothetical protein GCM10010885_19810 [Alicyclobacillus cellulosilyticus]